MVVHDVIGGLLPIKRTIRVLDVNNQSFSEQEEPSNKRVRPLTRGTSLANLISPVRNGAVRCFGHTVQSFNRRGDSRSPASAQKSSSRSTVPTPAKTRSTVLWSETVDSSMRESLTAKEIRRQEAIYEMFRGENDFIEDLKLARKAYHDPMLKLSIMSEEELTHIFGDLDAYIPLHEDLLARIGEATRPDGTVEQIGHILVNWVCSEYFTPDSFSQQDNAHSLSELSRTAVSFMFHVHKFTKGLTIAGTYRTLFSLVTLQLSGLNAYKGYCSNQLAAKALLDQKKQDPRVQDFLQRCLESPFSRKLDLWSFLDNPRSRLVKYPLLLKEILRHTPEDHPDVQLLQEAILIIRGVLSDINLKKGESECQYYIDKLEYLNEKQKDPRIEASKVLLCHGELKNKNGHKFYIFLFQDILVLTRPVIRNERHSYQVYRQPIPVQELVLEDLQDGDVRMGGSFRGAFGNSDKAKNIFRVRFQDSSPGQSLTLQANDVFHKQQWFNCIRAAIAPFQQATSPAELQGLSELHEECVQNNPSAGNVKTQRRVSTASSVTQVKVDGDASACVSPACTTDDMESVRAHQTEPGFRGPKDKFPFSSEWKETVV
ncbi:hypothetical protein MC885_011922 [Smutsia gigantea]|nr:hypothetical protein MC885_011922 [Smutsia gigantea]